MLYRETGQFKTTYAADQQIFPILQDRVFVIGFLVFAFARRAAHRERLSVPRDPHPVPDPVARRARPQHPRRLCGQISLGTGGFMAVGAYAAYNFAVRMPRPEPARGLRARGPVRDRGRHAVRHPEPAHQGLLPRGGHARRAVLHRLGLPRASSGSPTTRPRGRSARRRSRSSATRSRARRRSTCSCSRSSCVVALVAKNLTRGAIGRSWMAMRDMDVAAEVIGIRPLTPSSRPSR